MTDDIITSIRRRPAVHRLTYGAFLQGHVWIDQSTLVVPLAPMGFHHAVAYAAQYQQQLLGQDVEPAAAEGLAQQGRRALPILAFVVFTSESHSAEAMEREAMPTLLRAEELIGWISGDFLQDFVFLAATTDQIYVRTLPPSSRQRMLLGPGNVGAALQNNIRNIRELAESDERFAFALSTYRDALHETNKRFKIARLFSVLEALAYALKANGVGSRDAVRLMLGIQPGTTAEISYSGRTIRYERIALAGQLRDRLFHGVPFSRETLQAAHRDSFDILIDQPEALIRDLMVDCEHEFARWGNNTSVARTAAEGSLWPGSK